MRKERLKRVEEIREQIGRNTSKRNEKAVSLGHTAWERRKQAVNTDPYESVFRDIERVEKEKTGYEDIIRRIQETVNKKEEIETLRSALKEEMKSLERESRGTYEGLGRAVYGAHRDGLLDDDELASFFKEIDRAEQSLQAALDGLDTSTGIASGDTVLKKIADRGKTALIKTKIRAAEAKLARLYEKTGRAFCTSDILKRLEDASLRGMLEPFRTAIEGISKLKDKEKDLVSEEEQVDKNLAHLGVSGGGKKRLGELEQSIENCRNSLYKLHQDAGRLLIEKEGNGFEKVKEVKDLYREIVELETANDELEETITVVETNMQIDDLKAEVEEKDEIIRRTKEKIDSLNGEIKEQQKLKKQLQSEIRRLEKTIEPGEEA